MLKEDSLIALKILICAIILLVCIISSRLSSKIGIPVLLIFIILGMLAGSDGIFGVYFSDYHLTEQICSTALIFIMFYGGFGTNWSIARPVAVPSILLSSIGVVLTAALIGIFCYFVLGMDLLEGFLIGSVISSTDAASVFSILRSQSLNLKYGLASLLEIESGSNDPAAYMMTLLVLSLMAAQQTDSFVTMIFAQVGWGLFCGFVIAYLSVFALNKFHMENDGLHTIFVFAIALLSYALPTFVGGNGYLSVYISGIVMGNSVIRRKVELVHFFDGLTWIAQLILFFLIGLLSFPSELPVVGMTAVSIILFLTFVARPIAVFSILSFFRINWRAQLLVAWSGLRGAASIVFAIYAVVGDVYTKHDIFHIVFGVALLSVLFQGTLLPVFARKLQLVDDSDSVMRTFNDYQEEKSLNLIEMTVEESHPWCNKRLKQANMPAEFLVVLIKRKHEVLAPNGDTFLRPEDTLVLTSAPYVDHSKVTLVERLVTESHPWIGKMLKEIVFPRKTLVVLLKRGNKSIIPKGDTIIEEGDVLILNES